jgi:hypothetical protein
MDFDEMINRLTWKKMAVIAFMILLGIWLIREVIYWTAFREASQLFSQFNAQFDQQKKQIHNKLVESESDFDKQRKDFDQGFEKTHQMIEESSRHFQETMDKLDKAALEREKKFDEMFAKAPQQMLDQHKEMGEKMFNEFKEESRQQSNDFINYVMHDDKKQEADRCRSVLGNRPNNRMAPPGLSAQQLKDRLNNFMRIRKEMAKSAHCEAYV